MSDYPIDELAESPLFRKIFDLVKAIRGSRQAFDIILSDDLFYQYRDTLVAFLTTKGGRYNPLYSDKLSVNALYGIRIDRMYTDTDSGPKIVLVPSSTNKAELETYIAVKFSESSPIPETSGIYEISLTAEEMNTDVVKVATFGAAPRYYKGVMETLFDELKRKGVGQKEEEPQPPAKTPPVDIQNRKINLN